MTYAVLPCELRVIEHVLQGCTNKEIAARLKLKEQSVKEYMRRIFKSLGVSNRTEIVIRYARGI